MKTKSKVINVHVLQTVPAALLNRDFQGQSKSILFGNVKRTRVSSQCWKKTLRAGFEDTLPESQGAVRSQYLPQMVHEHLVAAGIALVYR